MNIAPISIQNNNNQNFTGVSGVARRVLNTAKSTYKENGVKGLYKQAKAVYKENYNKYIDEPLKEKVLAPILDSKFSLGLADKISSKSERQQNLIPLHMSNAGSVVTTYFYANQTKKKFKNDEDQKKRAKTLMLNQWGVTGVSALISYTLNNSMKGLSKGLTYKFRKLNPQKKALAPVWSGLLQLAIFTGTFRYISPVFVTPNASKLSKFIENRNEKKEKARMQKYYDSSFMVQNINSRLTPSEANQTQARA